MGVKAWIDQVRMSNEDRQLMRHQMSRLLKVYFAKKPLTNEQITLHYDEWSSIARRLRDGGKMLDSKKTLREQTTEYMNDLEEHYRFLLNLFGWYDLFFKKMLNDERRITKARAMILDIYYGVVE